MSDHIHPPFDDDALDRVWDALVRGQQPAVPLPPDVAQALRRLSSIDPAPQSSTVRERAWAEAWKRMQSPQSIEEDAAMPATQISLNHHQTPSIALPPWPENVRPAASPGRLNRKWAVVAALIAATLIAFMVYRSFDPIGSDPDNGPVIPAAVMQEVTPTPAPLGEHKITIDLPASMVHSTGAISAGWDYIEFPADSAFTYVPYCCPGPFIEYVLDGQLTVQSAAPMTIIRSDDTTESIPAGQNVTILTGDAFLAENEAELQAKNTSGSMTQLLGWVLLNDGAFQGHELGGFPRSLDVDLEFGMQVAPGPGQLVLTRYDTIDQIPAPGSNSYQFVLQALHNFLGTPVVASTLIDSKSTPVAGNGYDGFYVLDFIMSPPATASPEATPAV